jgi:hypothetical protein
MPPPESQDAPEVPVENQEQAELTESEEIEEVPLNADETDGEAIGGNEVREMRQERLMTLRSLRTDTRTAMGAQLSACGLLLTLSFGGLYFIITDGQHVPAEVYGILRQLLFLISGLLTGSMALGLMAIYSRSIPTGLGELSLEGSLSKSVSTERRYAIISTVILMIAIAFILFSLYMFHEDVNGASISNPSNEQAEVLVFLLPYEGSNLSHWNLSTENETPQVINSEIQKRFNFVKNSANRNVSVQLISPM